MNDHDKLGIALAEGLRLMKKTGAGMIKYIPKDGNGRPLACLIIAGTDEAADVLRVVEAEEARWGTEDATDEDKHCPSRNQGQDD